MDRIIPEPERGILDEVESRIIAAERAEQSTEVSHGDDDLLLIVHGDLGRLARRRAVDRNAARRTEGQP